jgi:hypothetical protein
MVVGVDCPLCGERIEVPTKLGHAVKAPAGGLTVKVAMDLGGMQSHIDRHLDERRDALKRNHEAR